MSEAEDAADHPGDRAHDRADRFAAAGVGRALDRLAQRQMLLQQPLANQELLRPVEHLRKRRPQLLRLVDERRHDHEPDAGRACR